MWMGNLIVVAGLAGLASTTSAADQPSLRIALEVRDKSIPRDVVDRAQDELLRIFRDSGTDIVWTRGTASITGPDSATAPTLPSPHVILRILSLEKTDQLSVGTTALGLAASTSEHRGCIAYIFYNRIAGIAGIYATTNRRTVADRETVSLLASVMAHELGHLLLGAGHSVTGLMGSEWNTWDLNLAVHGRLHFTAEQASLIRGRLRALPAVPPVSGEAELTRGPKRTDEAIPSYISVCVPAIVKRRCL